MDKQSLTPNKPATSTLIRFLKTIEFQILNSNCLIGPGLPPLVESIISEINSGNASGGNLIGKIRELLYGYALIQEKKFVQFGVRGRPPLSEKQSEELVVSRGAGGDITLFHMNMQAIETIQSKYITARGPSLNPFIINICEAARQLSGDGGEMPYLKSLRIADIVIEEPDFTNFIFIDLNDSLKTEKHICSLIASALNDEEKSYPMLHLWKHIDRIRITGRLDMIDAVCTCEILVSPLQQLKMLSFTKCPLLFKDFPYACSYQIDEQLVSLNSIIIDYQNELKIVVESSSKVIIEKPSISMKKPVENTAEVTLTEGEKVTIRELVVLKTRKYDALSFTEIQAIVLGITIPDQMVEVFLSAIKGDFGESLQTQALDLLPGLFGQIGVAINKNAEVVPQRINLVTRASKLFSAIEKGQKGLTKKMEATPEEFLLKLAEQQNIDPQILLKTWLKLTKLAQLKPQVAALAIQNMLNYPFGRNVCTAIASGLLEQAFAYNYTTVLGQLSNVGEQESSLGPLQFACDLWLTEQQNHHYPDCVLAFEYDENTPGMWQFTNDHFDMDIGWVLESSPLEIQSMYQVKVVANIQTGIINAAKSSLSGGQLSLQVPRDRGLIIYCPTALISDLPVQWLNEATTALAQFGQQNITLTIFFSKNTHLFFKLSDLRLLRDAWTTLNKASQEAGEHEPTVTQFVNQLTAFTVMQPLAVQAQSCAEQLLLFIEKLKLTPNLETLPTLQTLIEELTRAYKTLTLLSQL